MQSYSAIIVSFNNGNELFDCIESLINFKNCKEIILVDNGNSLEFREKIKAQYLNIIKLKYIINPHNLGFGAACNIGAKVAISENLLFLNPDAILLNDELLNLENKITEADKVIIGGLLIDENGKEQAGSRRGELDIFTALISFLGFGKIFPYLAKYNLNKNNEALPINSIEVENISGAFFTIKASDFRQISGFDEGYFLHLEDIDLCKRFRNIGGKIIFNPLAQAIHKGGASKSAKIIVEWHKYKGFIRYFWIHGNLFEKFSTIIIAIPLLILIMGRLLLRFAR